MILYDGIGTTNGKYRHTEAEFIEIMHREFTHKSWKNELENNACMYQTNLQLDYKDWILPDDFVFFTLDDWLDYSGAVKI